MKKENKVMEQEIKNTENEQHVIDNQNFIIRFNEGLISMDQCKMALVDNMWKHILEKYLRKEAIFYIEETNKILKKEELTSKDIDSLILFSDMIGEFFKMSKGPKIIEAPKYNEDYDPYRDDIFPED